MATTLRDELEEDWDRELPLPPRETLSGADQDPTPNQLLEILDTGPW